MAEIAITHVSTWLSSWIQQERQLLSGLSSEVDNIRLAMGQMRALLQNLDAKDDVDPQLKEWFINVREIVYDTEDVLEMYMLRFPPRDAHGFRGAIKRCYSTIKHLKASHQIASETQNIESKLNKMLRILQTYTDVHPIIPSSTFTIDSWHDGRRAALFMEFSNIVGIEKPKTQLLTWLYSSNRSLKISITGMAGLGKTILAKIVYDDSWVKMNFTHRVWIDISESLTVQQILLDVIKQLVRDINPPPPHSMEHMNVNELIQFIYNFLQDKKYLIVLDDVWRVDTWDTVKHAFPKSKDTGRDCIIITTRYNDIGKATCRESGHVYKLEPLPANESKELFYRSAFLENSCPPSLQEVSESILERCEGLPVAIVVIGAHLATKNNKIEQWKMFNRALGPKLDEGNLKRIWKLFSQIYYELPFHHKVCLLYLATIPKDQMLEKATILRLWIAEGFVEADSGRTMEEMAESYLDELLNRNLIQVAKTSYDGSPRQFHIHDLLREYLISKSSEQNLVIINDKWPIQWPEKTRRLALHTSSNCSEQIYKLQRLRSLLFFGSRDTESREILRMVLQSRCKLLKILNLRRAPLVTIPKEIFKFYHLEYICLRDTEINLIPKEIGNLRRLETLDLKRSRVTEMPIQILKLERLQYLSAYRNIDDNGSDQFHAIQSFRAPYQLGRLSSLQKLSSIDARGEIDNGGVSIVNEIGSLTKLQRLGITMLRREDGRALFHSLENLMELRSLTVSAIEANEVIDLDDTESHPSTFPSMKKLVLQGRLERVPQWIPRLDELAKLRLRWSTLQEDPLQYLQDLPNLQFLELKYAYSGEGLTFKAGGFQSLSQLLLRRLDGLTSMEVEKGSMPRLNKLTMSYCTSMTGELVGFEHLTELEYVKFKNMSKEFVEKFVEEKRTQGDQWRLKHVEVTNWTGSEWNTTCL